MHFREQNIITVSQEEQEWEDGGCQAGGAPWISL